MGLVRTLLALCVVATHLELVGLSLVDGSLAVQMFYVISGFLISYVLTEAGSYSSVGAFYLNRSLRLFPVYGVVAVASLIFLTATQSAEFLGVYEEVPPPAIAALAVSNVTLLGQDWIMFLGVDNQNLIWTANFRASDVQLWHGLLVPQAWTLGVELSFYLVAPFILKRRIVLIGALVASVAARASLYAVGLGDADPWSYRFFPAELSLFLLGALAHQVALPLARKLPGTVLAPAVVAGTAALLVLIAGYTVFPGGWYKRYAALMGMAGLLPFAFLFQQRFRLDSRIGDLSYPIYIGHMLVIWSAPYALAPLGITDQVTRGVILVAASIAFAAVLNRAVARPVEKLRANVRRGGLKRTSMARMTVPPVIP